ncbi:MAG TPA: hypothetical protein VFQ61_31375 [Polyangiaceae bacterium]|nr:hypothetical protein [Polyangiaceae bacterium]
MWKLSSRTLSLSWLAMMMILPACGSEDEPASDDEKPSVWVGEVTDSDALVGVAILGDDVDLFACGGPESISDLTVWLAGKKPVTRESPLTDGEFSVGFDVDASALRGDVANGDVSREFLVRPAEPGTLSGLYTADPAAVDGARLGLIVTQVPGESPMGQGALIRGVGQARIFEQVNPVFPAQLGDPIFVTLLSQPDTLIPVSRVVPGRQ